MTDAQRQAIHLAQHYFRLIAQRAGVKWDGDNDVEIELLVDYIADGAKTAAVDELRGELDDALKRIGDLEKQTPQARQLQYEADLAGADLAESGYDRHGRDCQCSYCATDDDEPEEYDPGSEVDDEGGMSEYRHPVVPEEPWS